MQPEQVGAAVRSGTTGIDPRLVPTYVPAGMSANVMAIPGGLSIEYTADGGQRRLLLAVMIANPPPIGANGRQSRVNFRGQSILYSVFDVNDPGSPRHMMWNEPGAAPGIQPPQMGVPYFASASGITEEEFFKVLNSLQKI